MSENDPQPLANLINQVIDDVVAGCPDSRAAELKREFDEAAEEVQSRFEKWKADALADRTKNHETYGLLRPNAERMAESEVSLLVPVVKEEHDQLIGHHWATFLRRLQKVLDDVEDNE